MKRNGSIQKQFNSLSLSRKLIILFSGLTILTLFVFFIINYFLIKNNIRELVIQDLRSNTDSIYEMVDNAYDDFKLQLRSTSENTKTTFENIHKRNPGGAKGLFEQVCLSQKIGKSGYLYCMNSKGVLEIHPKRELVGTSVIKNDFARFTIEKKHGTFEYKWQNQGETKPRPKIIGFTYYQPMDLYISVSAYLEEFADKYSFSDGQGNVKTLRDRIVSIKIGDTGYVFVMDSDALVRIHPNIEGKNVAHLEFVKEIIKNKKSKENVIEYMWEGKPKIAAFRYFEPLDWIIVSGSYYDEFFNKPMFKIKFVSIILFVLSGIIVFLVVSKSIRHFVIIPIKETENIALSYSNGDLSVIPQTERTDEIGNMLVAFSGMGKTFREIVQTLSSYVEKLSSTSSNMTEISNRLSSISQNQAASMEETSASLEETLSSISLISDRSQVQFNYVDENAGRIEKMAVETDDSYVKAKAIAELMNKTTKDARTGEKDLTELVKAMSNVKESMTRIAEITNMITDISDQVNLLSLNAAIEAARAGDYGKGFAVVADEISKLAEETANSAKTINTLIVEGNKQVDSGNAIINQTVPTFQGIIKSIDSSATVMLNFSDTLKVLSDSAAKIREMGESIKQLANEISISTKEQTKANEEVSLSVESVNEASQQLVAFADSIRQNSDEIEKISGGLKEHMFKFRL